MWTEAQQRQCLGMTQAALLAIAAKQVPFTRKDPNLSLAMSLLSDSQEEIAHGMYEEARQHINCAKFLICHGEDDE